MMSKFLERTTMRFVQEIKIQLFKNMKLFLPSLGMVRIGIWVMEPFLPSIRPARS